MDHNDAIYSREIVVADDAMAFSITRSKRINVCIVITLAYIDLLAF